MELTIKNGMPLRESKETSNGLACLKSIEILWLNWNEWKELRNGRDFCVGIYVHIYIQRNGVKIVETIRGISTRRRIEMTSTASVSFTFHGLVILEAFIECKPVGRAMCTCVSAFLHAIYIYIYSFVVSNRMFWPINKNWRILLNCANW